MPDDIANAYWTVRPGRGELRSAPLRPPGDGEVLVEALYGAVSRGTEVLVHRGEVPAGEAQRMRAPFQEGDFPGPVKYGYCSVGRVAAGPAALLGRTVFCLHPHQDRYVVPASAVHALPDDVPAARAVLAANLETAINGLWDGGAAPGDRIAVVGGGVVGLLVGWLAAQLPGADVELVDVDPAREDVAARLGLRFALPGAARDGADLVFHASGAPAGLVTALGLAGLEATIVEMSWYGTRSVPLPLGEAFHAQRLTIRSSQVGRLPPSHRARWDFKRRLALALSLLASPQLDALFSGESRFEDLPATLARLAGAPASALCERIVYPAAERPAT